MTNPWASLGSPLGFLVRIRWAIMDFGVDGFLDKFEKHFGALATKALLILIALAIVSVCVGAIWQWLVSPTMVFFNTPKRWAILAGLFYFGLGTGAGIVSGRLTVALWKPRPGRDGRDDVSVTK